MTAFWTLLACVADGSIVGAVIGGLLGWKHRRSILPDTERERVHQRYTALLDRGLNAPLSASEQREIMRLSQRWCELGLPQTPLGARWQDPLLFCPPQICFRSSTKSASKLGMAQTTPDRAKSRNAGALSCVTTCESSAARVGP